jgi:glycerophosphoryl diester phosphodiesterase
MADAARLNRPLLLGHRGARARRTIPENTFSSFDQALADGCEGFEFDVRRTADGAAVICHNARFRRIDVARAAVEHLAGIPQLSEVLARYRDRAFLDIELKVAGLEKTTVSLLRQLPPRRGFVVSSFLPEVLEAMHAAESAVPLGLICENRWQLRWWRRLPVEYVIAHYRLVDSRLVRELQDARKQVFVWTVNDAPKMRRFRELAVDAIISDDTRLLTETLDARTMGDG